VLHICEVEVGGCGMAGIYRVDPGTLVFVSHFPDEEDDEAEADYLRQLTRIPTAEDPIKLGTVQVESGVLSLVSLVEPVEGEGGSQGKILTIISHQIILIF